jgi:CPA2 family monovalent cation:H+ antiporter-2
MPAAARDVILAAAMFSIFLNPFLFSWICRRYDQAEPARGPIATVDLPAGHLILVGYGRVGKMIAGDLQRHSKAFALIEDQGDMAEQARRAGIAVVEGNALDARTLVAAGIGQASRLLIAIPAGFEGGAIIQHARLLAANVPVVVRAHSTDEVAYLEGLGADEVVMGEREIANRMIELARGMPAGSA